ncbi:hypothetical protein [Marivita hallyeonensis]|uniref:hypothetical protein n=1 Tax=Marivita hallyeonensis TaxID=996342 RepID=UPI0015B5579C|nr:hypothetical protein [Marivita hallyeonensis]
MDAASIDSVARLCEPQLAERGLRHMLKGQGDRTTRYIADTAGLLRRIGRVLGAEDDASEKLADMAHRLKAPTQKGMTRKNRDRLRVFKEAHTLRSLLLLPDRLFAQSQRVTQAHSRGLMREEAISIAILLYCPIRAKNLSGLHLEQHIARPGDGRAYLVFDEDDTKTYQPIEFELPASVVRMIDRHLATRAPAMCPGNSPWLFPRRDGSGPVEPGQLSGRLRRRILRDVGIEMNAHLFRHLAVMLWLDANPGAYEAARRLLGHRDVSQTINLYSGLETRSAMAEFSALVTSTKGRLA